MLEEVSVAGVATYAEPTANPYDARPAIAMGFLGARDKSRG